MHSYPSFPIFCSMASITVFSPGVLWSILDGSRLASSFLVDALNLPSPCSPDEDPGDASSLKCSGISSTRHLLWVFPCRLICQPELGQPLAIYPWRWFSPEYRRDAPESDTKAVHPGEAWQNFRRLPTAGQPSTSLRLQAPAIYILCK